MRSISFVWFKQNCKWLDDEIGFDLDNGKAYCRQDNDECFEQYYIESSGKYIKLSICSEKCCPVLKRCKKT